MPSTGTLAELATYLVSGYWSPHAFDTSSDNRITVNITGLTAEGRQLARWAMESWETVADIVFVETTGSAQIEFDDAYSGAYSGSTYAAGTISSAYVNIAQDWIDSYGSTIDSYAFSTYVHELGHALGLGHLGDYDGNAVYTSDALFANDSWQVSIMSYFDQIDNTAINASYGAPLTPMMADILAIQTMYGAPGSTSPTAGNTTWGQNSTLGTYLGAWFALDAANDTDRGLYLGGPVVFTIYDAGGHDLVDIGYATRDMFIDMRPGEFSDVAGGTGNVAVAPGTVIEELRAGSGDDTVIGNGADNLILGNAGNDRLVGMGGADTLGGGSGDDTLRGFDQDDVIWGGAGNDVAFGDNGRDLVWLGDGQDIFNDNTQTGRYGGDRVHGGGGSDTLTGGGGSDTLWGDGGHDLVRGGSQDDVLYGGAGNDRVKGGYGRDRAWLGDGDDVFHDILQGGQYAADTVYGGAGNDTIIGGEDPDQSHAAIRQGGGDDRFYGGDGADRILGGAGNDLLNGGRQNDLLLGGTGNDTVLGSNGADRAWLGDGNDYFEDDDQVMFGNDRVWGGNGNDTILLGGGDDTATGGAGADSFVFSSSEGNDLVTDYDPGIDSLTFAQEIWNGGLTVTQVIDSFADVAGGSLVFIFEPGYSVTLAGITDAGAIAGDITLV